MSHLYTEGASWLVLNLYLYILFVVMLLRLGLGHMQISNRGSVSACCIQHFMETCETALDLGSSTEAHAHTYTHIV